LDVRQSCPGVMYELRNVVLAVVSTSLSTEQLQGARDSGASFGHHLGVILDHFDIIVSILVKSRQSLLIIRIAIIIVRC